MNFFLVTTFLVGARSFPRRGKDLAGKKARGKDRRGKDRRRKDRSRGYQKQVHKIPCTLCNLFRLKIRFNLHVCINYKK